jgi:cysteine desulfurase
VLLALGIEGELAQTAVRFSFDASVTEADLDAAAAAVQAAVGRVRTLGHMPG